MRLMTHAETCWNYRVKEKAYRFTHCPFCDRKWWCPLCWLGIK